MNTPDEQVNPAVTGSLPVAAPTREVEWSGPVWDGELVDDSPPVPRRTFMRRFGSWWLRSRQVPAVLKSRQAARQGGQDAAVWLLRCPWRFAGAVVRGVVVCVRAWRRWVRVHDYREAAELSEKLADKFTEIRALTLFRWKVTGAVLTASAVIMLVVDLVYGARALWITVGVGAVVLAIAGRRKDGSPGRKAVLAGPRTPDLDDGPPGVGGRVPGRKADRQGRNPPAGPACRAGRGRVGDHHRSAGHPQGRRCDQTPGRAGVRAGRGRGPVDRGTGTRQGWARRAGVPVGRG